MDQISGRTYDIISNFQFWFLLIITIYITVLPFYVIRRYKIHFSDNIINNIMNNKHEDDFDKKTTIRKIEEMNKYKRFLAKFKKIMQLGDDYEPDNLADKKIKEWVMAFKRDRGIESPKKIRISPKNKNFDFNNIIKRMKTSQDFIDSDEMMLRINKPRPGNRLDTEHYNDHMPTAEEVKPFKKINLREDEVYDIINENDDIAEDFKESLNLEEIEKQISSRNNYDVSAPKGHLVHEYPLNITNLEDYDN